LVASSTDSVIRFGLFELDRKALRLSRSGRTIKLPQQPLQLLAVLLERPSEILTREELQQRLWSSDVVVDFDHGLNKSVQKLRDALGDSATSPRYIETIPRIGYRFIAPVVNAAPAQGSESGVSPPANTPGPLPPAVPGPGPQKHSRLWAACIVLLALPTGWLIYRRHHAAEPIRSIAVLPLENLSADPGQEYLVDGMTDELTTMLAKTSTLRVISRTSVMQYKGVHRPLPEIARELGVDGVLEGSVARSGDKVHMTIQLIQAASDTHLWADSYDRNINDVVSLPREAAQTIAKQLKSSVSQGSPSPRFVISEAHDAYLRGRYLWFAGPYAKAGQYFKKATELQPDYALAWAGLANYYAAEAVVGDLNPEEAFGPEWAAANKAIALDDSLAEGHLAMSAAFFLARWDWARAEAEINRAIELDPNLAEAYHFHAKMLAALNRHQEAIAAQKKASEIDPFARPWAMAMCLREARFYDSAISDLQQRLEADPNNSSVHWFLYDSYRRKGAEKEAAQELEQAFLFGGDKTSAMSVRRAFKLGGYGGVVRWELSDARRQSSTHYVSPIDLATWTAQLGRGEETLNLLEQAYRERSPGLLWIQNDPAFDFLHANERYRSIIRGIGLPPAY
jgi:TolB-like protein/DNA-binding winged helix-turn-helix (wHTH) protein